MGGVQVQVTWNNEEESFQDTGRQCCQIGPDWAGNPAQSGNTAGHISVEKTVEPTSSTGAVRVRRLSKGHLDTQLGGAGDRTGNLPVLSKPALPTELSRPHSATEHICHGCLC